MNYRTFHLYVLKGMSDRAPFWVCVLLVPQYGDCAVHAVWILGVAMPLFILSIQPSPQNKFILQNDVAKLGDAVLIPSWASIIITCYN